MYNFPRFKNVNFFILFFSVNVKVGEDMMNKMIQEAEKVWAPQIVSVMKETKDPFLNVIYDCDTLKTDILGQCSVDQGCCSLYKSSWPKKHKHVDTRSSSSLKMH